jgi:hypothetical protein
VGGEAKTNTKKMKIKRIKDNKTLPGPCEFICKYSPFSGGMGGASQGEDISLQKLINILFYK